MPYFYNQQQKMKIKKTKNTLQKTALFFLFKFKKKLKIKLNLIITHAQYFITINTSTSSCDHFPMLYLKMKINEIENIQE